MRAICWMRATGRGFGLSSRPKIRGKRMPVCWRRDGVWRWYAGQSPGMPVWKRATWNLPCPVPLTPTAPFASSAIAIPAESSPLPSGAITWSVFPEWRQAEDILTEFPVLVYPRPGARIPSWAEGRVTVADAPQTDVSSTEIRRKVRAGESLTDEVPPAILPLVEKYYRRQ